jgi:hypothetical protein
MSDAVHPLPQSTLVRHIGQQWARAATAVIVDWTGPYPDGSYEYRVRAGVDFSRRIGPDNLAVRETQWSSRTVRTVT